MTDPAGHLDLDALADALAGEPADDHLRSCRSCAARLAELAAADASVTAVLGALPAPSLPDGLSARLSGALLDERRRDAAPVRPLRRRAPAWLPAVAASAVLVMAGAVGWSLVDPSGRQGPQDAASSGGGGESSHSSGDSRSSDQDTAAAPEAAAGLALRPATDWADAASRPVTLSRLLDRAGPSAAGVPAGPVDAALERLRDPAALAACLSALPGGDDEVLAVDFARYAGAPAVAVVQPAGAGAVTVTVVGSGCSAADPELLSQAVLPRP